MGWGAVIGAGAQILGSSIGSNSAGEANQWANRIAERNRTWQENMSNTAYQRQRADAIKAGLNPILAMTGGQGATTPAGNVAETRQKITPTEAITAMRQAQLIGEEIKNMKENRELTKAQKEKIKEETNIIKPRGSLGKDINSAYQAGKEMAKENSLIYNWYNKTDKWKNLWKKKEFKYNEKKRKSPRELYKK